MKRRSFLKAASSSAVGAMISTPYWNTIHAALAKDLDKPVPCRLYKDDIKLSIIGFGGIVLMGQTQTDANREVARAIDRVGNYFDVVPTDCKGEAEEKLGIALKPFRTKGFLACKTQKRDGAAVPPRRPARGAGPGPGEAPPASALCPAIPDEGWGRPLRWHCD